MRTILFVDDEKPVLEGLQRMLRPMRKEWTMFFVESGGAALELLESQAVDVIISDMRMPVMDGVQLLSEVRLRFPKIIRFALSGHSDSEMLLESVKATHQFLAKPCDAETLKETVSRALALDNLLRREDLNKIVTSIDALPSLPLLYAEIMNEVSSNAGTLAHVGEIVSKDISMTLKLLQLVNSAFFGLRTHVESPAQAVSLLGLDVIRGLVLTTKVFFEFDQHKLPLNINSLFEHSKLVGVLAKKIAVAELLDRKSSDHALMAGMLHDIGKLILAGSLTHEYKQIQEISKQKSIPLWQAEQQQLGCTHGEIGAYLLGLWGFPNSIVEAVAFHHHPQQAAGEEFTPLTAVHIANVILQSGDQGTNNIPLDNIYIERLGLREHIPDWLYLRDELLKKVDEGNE